MSTWKRDIASGLIVLVPLFVLLYVLQWLYGVLLALPLPAIEFAGLAPWVVELLHVLISVVVFGLLVLAVGYLMRTTAGRVVEERLDDLINRLPVVRVVYNASKLAVETAVSGTEELQKPVKVEPWEGMRMTAFKTGKRTQDGRDVLFMPTAPNITTGFVMEVEPEDFEATDESVEEALTRVLSAGFGDSEREIEIEVTEESTRT